jgi:hypothetical protein
MIVHTHERPHMPPAHACESCELAAWVTVLAVAGERFRVCVACAADALRACAHTARRAEVVR